MIQPIEPTEGKLPYPTRPLKVQGGAVEENDLTQEYHYSITGS